MTIRHLSRRALLVAALLIATLASVVDAEAAVSAWQRSENSAARLISAQAALGDGATTLGLQITLAPKWKTYWRDPGDAGFPPTIDWSASTNLASAEMSFPAPRRFFQFESLYTNGYEDEVVFPIVVRAKDPSRPLVVDAAVTYAACAEICIPVDAHLVLVLPPGAAAPSPTAGLVARYLARVPKPPAAGDPAIVAGEAAGSGADRVLRVTARANTPLVAPTLFVESGDDLFFTAPETELRDGGREAVFRFQAPEGRRATPLIGQTLTLTLVDGARAIEDRVTIAAGAAEAWAPGTFVAVLVLAVLGGLILNLMPCVLPVLSLKLLGVVEAAGIDRRRVTARFLFTAAGILVAFLALAGFLVAVKLAGGAVGWGVQFQSPGFLIVLITILALFAYNLWGLYELGLPAWFAGRAGIGGDGRAGHFLSGVFATVLATPCSAPLLGTAIGFALARGPGEILAIFAALGVGMALPYLAIAAWPGVAARLPRPGPWMVRVRWILGLLLAATVAWLLSVLASQVGGRVAAVVAALALVIGAVLWLVRGRERWRPVGALAIVALMGVALAVPGWLGGAAPAAPAIATGDPVWRPFDEAAIATLVAQGKTVFVDVTAEWCVTCKFNKATVIDRDPVATYLASDAVVAMRADWTSPDPAIAAYLERFQRFGIPFNAVYGPALPRGYPLPELLTADMVTTAFERAGLKLAGGD